MTVLRGKDTLLHYSLLEGQARAVPIDSTRLCAAARRTHHLSDTATIALGRLLTGAAIMGDMLKGDGSSVTLTVKGGGPLGALVAVGRPCGVVKGYVDKPFIDAQDGAIGAAVGKDGFLTVVKDLGMGEPYVGQVPLVSGEIAEDLCAYYACSEQVPSLLALGVRVGEKGISAAGGILVQMLPGASEAAIQSVEMSAGLLAGVAGEIGKWGPDEAARQIIGHLQPVELERVTPEYRCDCSRERVERALISLGAAELESMIVEQGGCEAGCHFCNRKHRFSADDLRALAAECRRGGQPAGDPEE